MVPVGPQVQQHDHNRNYHQNNQQDLHHNHRVSEETAHDRERKRKHHQDRHCKKDATDLHIPDDDIGLNKVLLAEGGYPFGRHCIPIELGELE